MEIIEKVLLSLISNLSLFDSKSWLEAQPEAYSFTTTESVSIKLSFYFSVIELH